MKDTRYTYGATCNWHGTIQETTVNSSQLPCCPHCRGVLFEYENKKKWDDAVERFSRENNLVHYKAFVDSWRSKHCVNLHSFNWREEYKRFVDEMK